MQCLNWPSALWMNDLFAEGAVEWRLSPRQWNSAALLMRATRAASSWLNVKAHYTFRLLLHVSRDLVFWMFTSALETTAKHFKTKSFLQKAVTFFLRGVEQFLWFLIEMSKVLVLVVQKFNLYFRSAYWDDVGTNYSVRPLSQLTECVWSHLTVIMWKLSRTTRTKHVVVLLW